MKINKLIFLVLFFASSCAMIAGDKSDSVSISSQPSGADIFIQGINYGKTPATIKIEAKNQKVVLVKEGYGSAELNLETIVTAKNSACSADMITAIAVIPLYSLLWSGNCNEFKKKEHFVTIIPSKGAGSNNNSTLNLGHDPRQMINYYYGQQNGYSAPAQQYPNNGYNSRR